MPALTKINAFRERVADSPFELSKALMIGAGAGNGDPLVDDPQKSTQIDADRQATVEDIRHTFGDMDDTIIAEILSNRPSFRDMSDAAIWVRGDGDLTAREHKELSAVAIAIAEIMTREEEDVVEPE